MSKKTTLATAIAVALLAGAAIADWIELGNERRIEGKIVAESDDGIVTIEVAGGTVKVPRSAIVRTGAEPTPDDREKVAHKGGAETRLADYRYLDGWNAETKTVEVTRFTALRPVGDLAHGALVQVLESRAMNGIAMARVKLGSVEGWVPAARLRALR